MPNKIFGIIWLVGGCSMTSFKTAPIFWFSVDAWAEHLRVMSRVRSSKSNGVNRRTIRLLARKLVRKIFHFD